MLFGFSIARVDEGNSMGNSMGNSGEFDGEFEGNSKEFDGVFGEFDDFRRRVGL